jgi:sugar phosphate permease
MKTQWQLILLWGVGVGAATGVTSMVLAVVITNRWFETQKGVVLGTLSAANATGQLLFLPMLARLVESWGWRSAATIVAGVAVFVFLVVLVFLRDRPQDLGLKPFGRQPESAGGAAVQRQPLSPFAALRVALRSPAFWVLGGSFAICGASTNGLVGTHLIPACHDFGISEVRAANLLAVMGVFDILGTTASGWMTDRVSSRHLLFVYYMLRGISLMFLPHLLAVGGSHLNWFAVFYGLDWIATVPPTVRLTSDAFGKENTGVIYGWIGACHQIGASAAAFGAGTVRTVAGDYRPSFWAIGALCFATGFVFLFCRSALAESRESQLTHVHQNPRSRSRLSPSPLA